MLLFIITEAIFGICWSGMVHLQATEQMPLSHNEDCNQ